MMRILITGSNGFIGKKLADYLIQSQFDVIGLARSEIRGNNQLFEYIQCDLCDQHLTEDICKDIEIVIHLAGLSYPESKKQDLYKNNIKATLNLMKSAKKYKTRKVIFISSLKVNEDKSYYAASKFEAEKAVIESCEKFQIDYTILRIAQVYGHGMKSNIGKWILKIKDGSIGKLPPSTSIIPMVGINDLCNIIKCCIDSVKTSKKNYVVTDCKDYRVNTIEEVVRQTIFGNSSSYTYPRVLLYLLARFGDFIALFWARFPFQSRHYAMLFENTYSHDDTVYKDCNLNAHENFYDFIPEFLEVTP